MSNTDKRFDNITMNGRMCYIFMCIERYLLALYPDRDWTPVAKRMWQWTSYCCWTDDGLDIYEKTIPSWNMRAMKIPHNLNTTAI